MFHCRCRKVADGQEPPISLWRCKGHACTSFVHLEQLVAVLISSAPTGLKTSPRKSSRWRQRSRNRGLSTDCGKIRYPGESMTRRQHLPISPHSLKPHIHRSPSTVLQGQERTPYSPHTPPICPPMQHPLFSALQHDKPPVHPLRPPIPGYILC